MSHGLRTTTALLTVFLAMAGTGRADTLRWMPMGNSGGSGNWGGLGVMNFESTSGGPPVGFADGDSVIFGGTPGTVNVTRSTPPVVEDLEFEVDGYVLTGNDLASISGPGSPSRIIVSGDTTIRNNLDGTFRIEGDGSSLLTLTGTNANLSSLTLGPQAVADVADVGGDVLVFGSARLTYSGTLGSLDLRGRATAGGDPGDAPAITGDVAIRAGGQADLAGTVGGNVQVNGGVLDVTATRDLQVDGSLDLTAGGTVVTIDGTLGVDDGITGVSGTSIRVNAGGSVTSDIDTNGALTVADAVGGAAGVTGNVTVTGGTATLGGEIDGNLTLGTGTTLVQTDAIGVTGTLTNNTAIVLDRNATIGGGVNTGTITVDTGSTLRVTGAAPIDNSGLIDVIDTVVGSIDGGNVRIAAGGLLDGSVRSDDGRIRIGGVIDGTVDVTGDVTIAAGMGTAGDGELRGEIGGNLTVESGTSAVQIGALAVGGTFSNGATFTTTADVAAGEIDNSGTLNVNAGAVTVTGPTALLTNSGTLDVATRVNGNIATTGTTTVRAGAVVTGNVVATTAAANTTVRGEVQGNLAARGTLVLDGTVGGTVTVTGLDATLAGSVGGALDVLPGGIVTDTGNLTVTGRTTNGGTVTTGGMVQLGGGLDNGGSFTVGNGTMTGVTGLLTSSGTLSVGNGAVLEGDGTGPLTNTGVLTVNGAVGNVTAVTSSATGNLVVGGTGLVDADATVLGASDINGTIAGTLRNQGASANGFVAGNVDGGVINSGGARLTFDGNSRVTGTGVANTAIMSVTGTVDTATLTNSGPGASLTVTGRVTGDVASSAALTLDGVVTGDVDVTGGSAVLGGRVGMDLTLTGGALSQGSDLNVGGLLTLGAMRSLQTTGAVRAADVTNLGNLTVGGGSVVTVTGPSNALTNAGTLRIDGSVVGAVDSTGTLTLAGAVGGPATVTGDVDVTAGSASLAGDVTGNLTLAGGVTASQTGDVSVGGTLLNETGLAVNGTLSAGAVTNNGTLDVGAGDTLVAGGGAGLVTSNGVLTVDGAVSGDVTSTGALTLTAGGTGIDGTVRVRGGTAALAGTIGGGLALTGGTATQTGDLSVGGILGNTVTFDVNGRLSAAAVTNIGTLNVGDGDTLSVAMGAGLVENTGRLTVGGDVEGDVTSSGVLTLSSTADVTGDVAVTGGTAGLAGNVGNLALTGGTATQAGALTVAGVLDIDTALTTTGTVRAGRVDNSGVLNVAGGTNLIVTGPTGTLANTGGTLGIAGRVTGDVTSGGAGADLTLSGAVDGDLTVAGGVADLSGRVRDDLILTGGTITQSGSLTVGGTLDNGTVLTIGTGPALTVGDILNRDSGTLTVAGPVVSDITSLGVLTLRPAARVTGDVDAQDGTVELAGVVDGDLTLGAGVAATHGGALNVTGTLASGTTAETVLDTDLTVGALTNTGALALVGARLSASGAGPLVVTNDGRLRVTGASVVAGSVTNTGIATLAGQVTGNVTNSGTATLTGTIGGDLTATAGVTRLNGTVRGNARIGGNAALAGSIDGNLTVTDPTVATQGALTVAGTTRVGSAGRFGIGDSFTGEDVVVDGALVVDTGGAATVNGSFASTGDVQLDGTLTTATLSNAGTLDLNGRLVGALSNAEDGEVTLSGTVTGAVTSAGTLTVDGDAAAGGIVSSGAVTVADGTTLTSDLDVTDGTADVAGTLAGALDNAGTTEVSGEITGDVTNAAGGALTLAGAALGGGLTTASGSTTTVSGAARVTGATVQGGTLDLADGGTLRFSTLEQTGTFTIGDGATVTGSRLTNSGLLQVFGAVNATLENSGDVLAGPNARFGRAMRQNGLLQATDDLTFAGGTVLGAMSVTSLQQDRATQAVSFDTLDVTGPLSADAGAVLAFDIDVSEGAGGPGSFSDLLRVRNGALTGDLTIDFAPSGTAGVLDDQGILFIDVDSSQANAFDLSVTGLEAFGPLVYRVVERDGDQFVTTITNPNIGALPGTIGLTQSLIGQVVNRPSSPFVGALVSPEGEACGAGLWSRAIGGYSNTSGGVTSEAGSFTNDLEATYGGLQLGGDFGCFEGGFYGFDVALGGIAGYTQGTVSQDIFGFDPVSGGIDTSTTAATVNNDFGQGYVGAYVSAARGPLVVDLQYRAERTEFELSTSDIRSGGGIGVPDQSFESTGQTLSGSLSYSWPFGAESSGLRFGATTGFALSRNSTDDVDFAGDARLEVDDNTSTIGFIGGAVTRTNVAEDGRSALTLFGTGTYYGDFSDPIESTFHDGFGNTERVSVDPIGDYGEVSVGLNYVRILDKGQVGPARQFTGSLRVDGRYSDRLESVGLTAQVRLQF